MTEIPTWFVWVNLTAILLGPILAVVVAQYIEFRRNAYERRMAVFRDLMRYRRTSLSSEYVGALNLVEVEFSRHADVISAWRSLYEHLGAPRTANATYQENKAWNEKTDRLHVLLIHSIARSAKLPLEQLDIIAGYVPQAWQDNEDRQSAIQNSLLNVLTGKQPLRIAGGQELEPHKPWPEPPE